MRLDPGGGSVAAKAFSNLRSPTFLGSNILLRRGPLSSRSSLRTASLTSSYSKCSQAWVPTVFIPPTPRSVTSYHSTSRQYGLLRQQAYGRARDLRTAREYSSTPKNAGFGEITEDEYLSSAKRFKPLDYKKIVAIFGPGITTAHGNHLLDTIQKQRVTGTLDHDVSGAGVTKARISKALQWLRVNYPIDEDAAIMSRIEREEEVIAKWEPQQGVDKLGDLSSVYGESELEKRVQHVKEVNAAREEKEKAEREKAEAEGKDYRGPTGIAGKNETQLDEHGRPQATGAEWVKKYRERARLSDHETVPDVSPTRILLGVSIITFTVIGLSVSFALEYTPPKSSQRLFPDIPPAAATVGGIIAANTLVWLMWRVPPLWRLMNRHFLLVTAAPSPLGVIGNIFSHQGLSHLASNMLGLWFIGTQLCDEIGRGKFLALYFASGVFGAWLSTLRFILLRNFTYTSLGASGAVLGVIGAYCVLYPDRYLTIAFLPEDMKRYFAMRAEYILWTLVLISSMLAVRSKTQTIDHAAHLGGLLGGIGSAAAIRWQARSRRDPRGGYRPTDFRGFGGR